MDECNKTCREKYWSEIDDSEKIKRLRAEIKRLQFRYERLLGSVVQLENHQHIGDNLVVNFDSPRVQQYSKAEEGDDCYF